MLTDLTLRHFRCFDALTCEFSPGTNVFIGPNAQGKTSLLEAVCVLLRLQSPRITRLAHAIQHERRGFVLDGHFAERHLQFYLARERKKLALDEVEQKTARQFLEIARVVWFSNPDIQIVRGGAEHRRKFLDFVAMQVDPNYRAHLRSFERALRSRNMLLKSARQTWREIAAFDRPLVEAGNYLTAARGRLVTELDPTAAAAQAAITHHAETLALRYVTGSGEQFATALESARPEDSRLRQTTFGPHRDDVSFSLNERGAEIASEGQQRSIALALKLAQAQLLTDKFGAPPLLLIDDIFGELDVSRRNALLQHLPAHAQQLITTTHTDWMQKAQGAAIFDLSSGKLSPR